MAGRRKRLIVLAAVIAALAGAGILSYPRWLDEEAANGALVLYGNIDIREADLAFNVAGRVDRMLVEEGDRVQRGQLLATLETDIYDAEFEAAKARLSAERAVLDRLLAGSRPEDIKEARANVQAIEAELQDARANLQRTEKLATSSFATQQKLDEDRTRVTSLEAQLNAANQRLSLAIQGPREEYITEARAQVQATEAELTLARRRLDHTNLFAKEAGVVTTRAVEPGAVVLAQAPVYTIALADPVWVRTYVSEPDLGRIHPGTKALVTSDTAPGKPYQGWVGFISPVAEFTPKTVETPEVRTSLVYRLRVYVENPDEGLRQGMPVTVRLATGPGAGPTDPSAAQ
ncbi:efflux RND transporter periplasmic adaptor subunit [Tistlia consotensis]|nr:efflux RND transporter periplasmic adaptor subunit [Tistlia consotensis]